MTSMTRGPRSPGVYWRRRLFVLGLGAALVVLVAGVLQGGSDGSSAADPDAVAAQAAATPRSASPSAAATAGTDATARPGGKRRKQTGSPTPTAPPLAEPSGPCVEGDVVVEPVVEQAVAGSEVAIALDLRTVTAEACTWRISSKHVTVVITSGDDEVWASRKCPRTIPVTDVVIRREVPTRTTVLWNAHRSNLGCPGLSRWALPGYYHVAAAALGGEPSDLQFRLAAPQRPVITQTPKPTQKPKATEKPKATQKPKPDREPAQKPTRKPADQSTGQGGASEPAQPRSD